MKLPTTLIAASVFALSLAPAGAEAGAMDDVLSRGALRIGIASENFIPWLAASKSGDRMGYEIDVATGVAEAMNVTPVFVEMPFNDLLRGLRLGSVDVVISGMSVSADRALEVLFTAPYGSTDYTVVVDKTSLPDGSADSGHDVEGVKIGVAANTLADYAASAEFQKAELVRFDSEGDIRDALVDGQINGVIAPTPYPDFIVSRAPDRYEAEAEPLLSTVQAMAVRPDSQRFLNFLNAWIVENDANGTLEGLQDHWFHSLNWVGQLEGYEANGSASKSE